VEADAYNPDSICWALGVGPLDPAPVSTGWVLRVLLQPSFHAEVCVTITADAPSCSAEVVVPTERVSIAGPLPQFVWRATTELATDFATDLPLALMSPPEREHLMIDGMSFAAVLRTPTDNYEVRGGVSLLDEAGRWIREQLVAVHARIDDPGCRRGLACAGIYVGLALACPESTSPPSSVRVAVLGPTDEREAVVRALSVAQERRAKPKPP
jgi:hypothetical protein